MQLTYLLYPGVEPIDLAPLGVISMGRRVVPQLSYQTVAPTLEPVVLSNGLKVLPDVTFAQISQVDVLLVPGGPGWKQAAEDAQVVDFIRRWAPDATLCSICTGGMIVAAAGVLDGLTATTKSIVIPPETSVLEEMKRRHPSVNVTEALLVDNGKVITGGGVTLCIDATLYLIETRYGAEAAEEIARIMEYGAARQANSARLATVITAAQSETSA